ncbi:MAG: sigma 54-interacting transcriptional regulator [Myxococcales bacterium]
MMKSSSMRRLDQTLRTVAPKDVIVSMIGESGTGKEVLARRVHELSERRHGPFIPINCAAIPDSLFESELFGHEKGAFTGASERVKGKVEAASGGTLFLDEIGEMPLGMQAKMLRFLENRRFMRVGGSVKIQADIRLVFATLRPLEEDVRNGRFRADLYYRMQGITIRVPPLRERQADIPQLVDHFLEMLSARHGNPPPHVGRRIRDAFQRYSWPGNVRELRNVLEMLCLLRAGKTVRPVDIPEPLLSELRDAPMADLQTLTLQLDQPLDSMIEQITAAVLAAEGGNRTRAAQRLGISLRTIQRHVAAEGSPANPAPARWRSRVRRQRVAVPA